MIFINSNNEYPRFLGDLKLDHPNWQIDDELPEGWKLVNEVAIEIPEGYTAYELFPVFQDGQYYQNWEIVEDTSEPPIPWQPFILEE